MNNKKPKIIFAGTSTFAIPILEKLIEIAEVLIVLTQPPKPAGRGRVEQRSPVDLCAQDHCLSVLHPLSLKKEDLEPIIQEFECDYLVVAAYGKIIPEWLLNWPKCVPINVHCSLLPRWRGAAPIQHALLSGDQTTGTCIMRMTKGLDEGPIYVSESISISKADNQQTLTEKLSQLGAILLQKYLTHPKNYREKQQQGTATYAHKIEKNHGEIEWQQLSAIEIDRKFRALTPWPGLYTFTKDQKRLKILDLSIAPEIPVEGESSLAAGSFRIEQGRLFVKTKSGWIELLEVQLESQKSCFPSKISHDPNHWVHTLCR